MAMKPKKEASVVAGVKGVQGPGSGGPVNIYKKKDEKEDRVDEIVQKVIKEVIKKQGSSWVIINPQTGAQIGVASSRDAAREMQRKLGVRQKRKTNVTAAAKPAQHKKPTMSELKQSLRSFLEEAGVNVSKKTTQENKQQTDGVKKSVKT